MVGKNPYLESLQGFIQLRPVLWPSSILRVVAVASFVGGLSLATPLHATVVDTPSQPQYASKPVSADSTAYGRNDNIADPKAMAKHVEDRIKTLHSKLNISSGQEAKWENVAQVMRDNEAAIGQLIQMRHQDPAAMTAIDDLISYQKIAQAHVDGLQRLIPVFQTLYDDMSDEQKLEADKVFNRFEGHRGQKMTK